MIVLIAIVTGIIGVGVVYLTWRNLTNYPRWSRLAGWSLITLAAILWVSAEGAEYGSVYFVAALPLSAWLAVLYQVRVRPAKYSATSEVSVTLPSTRSMARQFGMLLLILPISGLVSTLIALQLVSWLPWAEIDRLALVTVLMPTIWGVLMFWCCAGKNTYRPAGVIIFFGLCTGLNLLG